MGNSERWGALYLEKAAGEVMQGALPEEVTPNPIRTRLGWKQETAPLSPSSPL